MGDQKTALAVHPCVDPELFRRLRLYNVASKSTEKPTETTEENHGDDRISDQGSIEAA